MSAALILTALAAWAAAATWLAVVDFRTHTLPTRVIWTSAGLTWSFYIAASLLEAEPSGLIGAAIGGAVCGGLLALVHFAHPPSMGFGDVRLAVLNGLLCGWWGWRAALLGLVAGFFAALPEAIITLLRRGPRAGRPLGPYLIVGSAAAAIWNAVTVGLVPFGQ